jgi:hypothetical protein
MEHGSTKAKVCNSFEIETKCNHKAYSHQQPRVRWLTPDKYSKGSDVVHYYRSANKVLRALCKTAKDTL